jgi:hypothetical protein
MHVVRPTLLVAELPAVGSAGRHDVGYLCALHVECMTQESIVVETCEETK